PLGAQFVVFRLLRLQVLDGGADRIVAFAAVHARRRGRGAVGEIDAAVLRGLEHHAGLVVEEVVVVAQAQARGRRERFGRVVVPAQAEVDQPLRAQLDGVERIDRGGRGLLGGVQRIVAAGDRVGRRPRIIRVRVVEVGAVVAGRRAGGAAGLVAGQRVVGACAADDVAALAALFFAVLHAGAVAVLQAAGLEGAGQAELVGERPGVDGAVVGAAPQ